jgi:transcription termination/antitermination protein NusA
MSKELLLIIETVANEKEVEKAIILEAMEEALAAATAKTITGDCHIKVTIDQKTGEYTAKRVWTVVDEDAEIENYHAELYVDIANEKGHDVQVGDTIEEDVEVAEFGRISAQAAKQIIVQKVRAAERKKVIARFREKIGKLVYGSVKRVTREFIIVDIGDNAEGLIYRTELLPREIFRINDNMRACLVEIDEEAKGHQLFLSRIDNRMVTSLFELEVPEISEELIEIVDITRDPGSRSKIAVKTNDGRIDPVGSCVGMRGSRVQSITNELQGERIDIVLWDANPAQYVINSLSPAEVVSIIQDEDRHSMDVAVKEEELAQAIGKNGQNVKMASELTGWKLNVMAESQAEEKQQEELQSTMQVFMGALDVEDDIAAVLVEEGFSNLEEVAYVAAEEIAEIEGFDEEIASELQERAKNALLTQAISATKPADDLLAMEGMDESLANTLAENGIITMEDLAELAVDDLQDVVDIDDKKAAQLILTARAPWFAEDNQ